MPVALLGLAVAVVCCSPPVMQPAQVASPASVTLAHPLASLTPEALDSLCSLQSGIGFALDILPPRKDRTLSVNAHFGTGAMAQLVPRQVLQMSADGLGGQMPNSGIYRTPSTGTLPISVTVFDDPRVNPSEGPIALVRLEVPLKRQWLWTVAIRILPMRASYNEFRSGTAVQSATVPLPTGDSLYERISGEPRRSGIKIR